MAAYILEVADDLAPGADISTSFLPGNDPISKYPASPSRRLLAVATNPMGAEYTITWPPADSNATALRFQSRIPALVIETNSNSRLGLLGPAEVPLATVRITTTYAPPPPVQSPPPPPSTMQSSPFDGPLPPSPSSQSTPPIQVSSLPRL